MIERANSNETSTGSAATAARSRACVEGRDLEVHDERCGAHDGTDFRLQRVLAATDFSSGGDHAVKLAYAGIRHRGVVVLLHVLDDEVLPGVLFDVEKEALRTAARMSALARLQSLVPRAATQQREIETLFDVHEAWDAADSICRVAERMAVDLICMGAHGRSAIAIMPTGIVAQKVMKRCRLPVLLVSRGAASGC